MVTVDAWLWSLVAEYALKFVLFQIYVVSKAVTQLNYRIQDHGQRQLSTTVSLTQQWYFEKYMKNLETVSYQLLWEYGDTFFVCL